MNSNRWTAFERSKAYDLLAALPLFLWYGNAVRQQIAALVEPLRQWSAGTIGPLGILEFTGTFGSLVFGLALIVLLLIRRSPVAKSKGILPRLTAFIGTFVAVGIIHLPRVRLTLSGQLLADILIVGGSIASLIVILRLGRAFSIMPEARALVTSGPYETVRHPLYVAEAIVIVGVVLQYQQPWALLLGLTNFVFQYLRSIFEERVLLAQYPEYADYQKRTSRFIPGVF